ncbi:MAG: DNA polymerase I [Desulfobacteraceae bacterium]|nr:DNA polymerase I [Desulfobacteraceae bacterium]
MKKTLYLIDGSSYIHRAYHAIRGLANSKGLPTNAVFGFTKMLVKLINDKKPEYIAMLFDAKGPTFRHEIYDQYKANRPPMPEDMALQIPYIKKVTEGFNIPLIEMQGYEADDLIGTLARIGEQAGFSVIMVTGDKDFFQLVTDKIIIWDPMKEKTTDTEAIKKTFGLDPPRILEVMGLSGDTSDNIPGVPGIGQKTALSLIQAFGTMEVLYQQVSNITKKKQKENLVKFKDQAFMSRELARIDTNVPLSNSNPEDLKLKSPDNAKLSRLFKELEFRQLQKDYPVPSDLSKKNYTAIYDTSAIANLVAHLESSGLFAFDTETTSEDPMKAELVGFSFSINSDQAFYIPCAHDYLGAPEQPNLDHVLELLKPVLENPAIKKIGQNIKYDWMILNRYGIRLAGIVFDTMLASYLINPSKRAHNLDEIAADFLDHRKIAYKEVAGKDGFSKVPVENAVTYACEDADITLMAYNCLDPMLKQQAGLSELMENVEMPLIPVLMGMEMRGICVDREKLRDLSKSFEHRLERIEQDIYSIAGEEFNINSTQQLGQILFEKLGLPVQKKTKKKTGYSTDVDVLTSLAPTHELPALILNYRTLAKLKSTYSDALADLINPKTGRIHTSYNQTVTATGRLSSSDPNLQNIPIRTDDGVEIRRAFVPQKGWHLISADYSQIELRILAHYSNDKILLESFSEDEDIHTRTAIEVFQVIPSFVTPDLRRQAKTINFSIIYGISAFSLSKDLGVSRRMAQTFIDNYFITYKGVKQLTEQIIEEARQTKQTSTLLGRIRHLQDINSSNRNTRLFAERIAVNTPIQGTAADLIKIAMIKTDAALKEKNLKAGMLLSVHDELVFEAPPDETDIVKSLVKEIMENVWELRVPLKVNAESGRNWAEAH